MKNLSKRLENFFAETSLPKRPVPIFKANFVKVCEGLNHQNWIELLTKSFTEDYDTFCRILAKVVDENTPPAKDPTKKRSIYMNHDALRLKNT